MMYLIPGLFVLFSLCTLYAYRRRQWSLALACLLGAGFALRLFVSADPFLHDWDERFHAVVARHLMEHPFLPTLVDHPVVPYDIWRWDANHVWLSKPPLPLWCMAGSLKIFGISEYALRAPSVVWSMLSVYLTFLLGATLFNRKTALIAAYLHAIHGTALELAGGRIASDHVETCFLFFFEWAMLLVVWQLRPRTDGNKWRPFFIGLLTGAAFLCKWTAAFMVILLWLALQPFQWRGFKNLLEEGLRMAAGMLLVAGPWVYYCWQTFPAETAWMAGELLNVAVKPSGEAQTLPCWYYLDFLRMMFGDLVYLPVLWLLWKILKRSGVFSRQILAVWIWFPLMFLSLMASKRFTYLMVSAPALFCLTALFIRYCLQLKPFLSRNWRWAPALVAGVFLLLPVRYTFERVKFWKLRVRPTWYAERAAWAARLKDPSHTVLLGEPHHLEAMFYWNVTAYNLPYHEHIDRLKSEGYRVYENWAGQIGEK